MTIEVTRTDPLSNEVLSVENLPDWEAVITSIKARGVDLSEKQAQEIAIHYETQQFRLNEFVNCGVCGYSCRTWYDIREIKEG